MWKLQVLLYSFLLPREFTIVVGSFNLSAYRVFLIVITPWILWRLFTRRTFRWQTLDTLAITVCIWPFIALTFNSGMLFGIESGGVLFLETFVPFFTARLLIHKYQHLVQIAKTLLIVSSVMAITAIPEALTGRSIVHELASQLTDNNYTYTHERRLGVWRSYGPTDHPIILGTFCAVAIPLGFALLRRRLLHAATTAFSILGVVASASSGPLLSIIAQFGLYFWSALLRGRRRKWWLLILGLFFIYLTVDILSDRDPFRVMFSYLLFNEHNGYVRYNMWQNSFFLAGQSMQSFIVGYGFSTDMMALIENPFWAKLMSSSIDSYWVVILLRYGAPMLMLNVFLVALVLRANVRNYQSSKLRKERRLVQAWLITTVSMSLVACTVHFWGATASLFFIVLACTGMQQKRHTNKHTAQPHQPNKALPKTFITEID